MSWIANGRQLHLLTSARLVTGPKIKLQQTGRNLRRELNLWFQGHLWTNLCCGSNLRYFLRDGCPIGLCSPAYRGFIVIACSSKEPQIRGWEKFSDDEAEETETAWDTWSVWDLWPMPLKGLRSSRSPVGGCFLPSCTGLQGSSTSGGRGSRGLESQRFIS